MPNDLSPAVIFKCLADETRIRLILMIAHGEELCVCELKAALGESQPKISRHLASLRNLGLLEGRRQGQWVYYRLNPSLPGWVSEVLDTTLEASRPWLAPDLEHLANMRSSPKHVSACL